jgi:hypothetical protein
MKKYFWLVLLPIAFVLGMFTEDMRDRFQFTNAANSASVVLNRQQAAWNAGNLSDFLADYDMSDDISFFSDDRVTKGWVTISERYQNRYGQPGKMGKLAFTDLEFTPLSGDAVVARGRWAVSECEQPGSGLFTLLIRKTDIQVRFLVNHNLSQLFNREIASLASQYFGCSS